MFELRYLNALHAKPESFPKRHAFDTPFKRNTRKILLFFKRGFSFKQTKLMYRMHRGKIHSDYKESVVSCFRRNCIDDFSYNIIFLKIYTDDPSFFGVPISIYFILQYVIFLGIVVLVEIGAVVIAAIFKGQVSSQYQMCRIMREVFFAFAKTKAQIRCMVTAQLNSASVFNT